MAPSQVQIATSALQRLMKEEKSYYKELEQQQTRITKLEKGEGGDSEGNEEYQLKQEVSRSIRCSRQACDNPLRPFNRALNTRS